MIDLNSCGGNNYSMAKSKKPGRPKAVHPLKYRTVRVSDPDWDSWDEAAKRAGYEKLSAWIRDVLNRAAKRGKR